MEPGFGKSRKREMDTRVRDKTTVMEQWQKMALHLWTSSYTIVWGSVSHWFGVLLRKKNSLSPQVTVSPERQGILSQTEPTYLLLFPRKGKTMLWEVEIKNACVTHLILFFNNLLIFLFSRIWILKMSMIYFDVLYYELTQSIISMETLLYLPWTSKQWGVPSWAQWHYREGRQS